MFAALIVLFFIPTIGGGYGGADLVEALNIIHIVCASNGKYNT